MTEARRRKVANSEGEEDKCDGEGEGKRETVTVRVNASGGGHWMSREVTCWNTSPRVSAEDWTVGSSLVFVERKVGGSKLRVFET